MSFGSSAVSEARSSIPSFVAWFNAIALTVSMYLMIMYVLHSNSGIEYTGKAMTNLCLAHGIRQQFSLPYTPQRNGVAERVGRTLQDAARALQLWSPPRTSGAPPFQGSARQAWRPRPAWHLDQRRPWLHVASHPPHQVRPHRLQPARSRHRPPRPLPLLLSRHGTRKNSSSSTTASS